MTIFFKNLSILEHIPKIQMLKVKEFMTHTIICLKTKARIKLQNKTKISSKAM
jgi:hypothetical protein